MRYLEPIATLRLLNLARYYESAELLRRAMLHAASQLLVPMFMLLIMTVTCSALLVELEFSPEVTVTPGLDSPALSIRDIRALVSQRDVWCVPRVCCLCDRWSGARRFGVLTA